MNLPLPLPVDRSRRNWGLQWESVKDRERKAIRKLRAQTVAGPSARHRIQKDTCPRMGGYLGVFIFKQGSHIFILLWAPQMMQLVLAGRLCVAGQVCPSVPAWALYT